jgi:hypothetical protein
MRLMKVELDKEIQKAIHEVEVKSLMRANATTIKYILVDKIL